MGTKIKGWFSLLRHLRLKVLAFIAASILALGIAGFLVPSVAHAATGSSSNCVVNPPVIVNGSPVTITKVAVSPTCVSTGSTASVSLYGYTSAKYAGIVGYWAVDGSSTVYGPYTINNTSPALLWKVPFGIAPGQHRVDFGASYGLGNSHVLFQVGQAVTPPPAVNPTVSLAPSKTPVTEGQQFDLKWGSKNAVSLTASGAWSGSKSVPSGHQMVTAPGTPGTYTYNLTATGAKGTTPATAHATVVVTQKVTPPPPPCQSDLSGVKGTVSSSANGTVTYTATLPKPACSDLMVYGDTYTLPKTYDGSGKFDPTASPQYYVPSARAMLEIAKGQTSATATQSFASALKCGVNWLQKDTYTGPQQNVVTYPQGSKGWLAGGVFKVVYNGPECQTPPPPVMKAKVTVEVQACTKAAADQRPATLVVDNSASNVAVQVMLQTEVGNTWQDAASGPLTVAAGKTLTETIAVNVGTDRVVNYKTGEVLAGPFTVVACKGTTPKPPVPPTPPQPKVTVTYGAWQGGKPDCKTPVVEQTRTVITTTTTYTEVWNPQTKKYDVVAHTKKVTKTESRALHYKGSCTTPPKHHPAPPKSTGPTSSPTPKPTGTPTSPSTPSPTATSTSSSSSTSGVTGPTVVTDGVQQTHTGPNWAGIGGLAGFVVLIGGALVAFRRIRSTK